MDSNRSWRAATTTIVPLLPFLLICSIQVANSGEFKGGLTNSETVRWQILTKANYSSEIRRHPHLLLLITVPWSGESRYLMKELAYAVANEQGQFGALKLMLLYKSSERILASSLGASEGTTVLYFHHSSSYKYGGRLRVPNILSSVRHVMSLLPKEHPLTPLNTPEELRNFLGSTDKALLLLEFCGWTSKLLGKGKNNTTENAFGLGKEASGTLQTEKRKQKGAEYYQLSCNVNNRRGGVPWLSEFTLVNHSFFPEVEDVPVRSSFTCSLDDLQRFESFLPKFMNVAREFVLPPERIQFGLVFERALLSELNIEASDSWLMTLQYAGCPSCSKVLREGDDLKVALQTQQPVVRELGDNADNFLPSLPANKPSILLFIDRSSDLSNIREQSKDALHAFRKLALHHRTLNKTHGESTDKDKTSLLVMNKEKQITIEKLVSDLQGSSLHEMLAYLFQHKKELKLSSLAKDAGFQLLSEDLEIKVAEALSSHPEEQSDTVLDLSDSIREGTADSYGEQKLQRPDASNSMSDEDYKRTYTESLQQVNEKNPVLSVQLSARSTHSRTDEALGYAQDRKSEEETLMDRQKRQKYFSGSFFFCDGHFRLLRALTAGSRIPSAVIIDPIVQQHYIIPEKYSLNYSSLSDFLDEFLNGSLTPYQHSEPVVQSSREVPVPPFVNLDFHEADSIPRVSAHTFTEQVLGNQFNSYSSDNAWDRDVLVLLTNTWCGFCQRMELIVREVYRSIKSYTSMLNGGMGGEALFSRNDNRKSSSVLKVPLIYLMDCTLNDCSLILRTSVKRELYPSLLLFPAVRKEAIAYEGDFTVSDILNFLAYHGILIHEKGILWPGVEQSISNRSQSQTVYHEVLLKDSKHDITAEHNQIQIQSITASYETTSRVVVGSFLTATDNLLNLHPFDESKILIVKVDQSKGIEGLIVNKLINWDSLEELGEGPELLKKAPLSFGGPVIKRGMPLVALSDKCTEDQHIEVLPGVCFFDQWATLQLIEELRLRNESIHGYWFFLGFSSWVGNQLFHEIAEGAWHVSDGNISQLDWPKFS